MERNKMEDRFREILEKREIKPSENSWEILSGQLSAEEKKQVHLFWWIGIAATLVGGFFIAGMVFNTPGNVTPEIVVTPVEETHKEELTQPVIENELAVEKSEQDKTIPETKPEVHLETSHPEKVKDLNTNRLAKNDKPESENINNKEFFLSGTGNEKNEAGSIAQTEITQSSILKETELAAEIENVLSRLAEIETGTGTISGSEVDSLLYEAAYQISMKRNFERSNGKIDATALLWDVEMEMEHSFREKIFEVLKDGYLKAKWAVANRNQ